MFQANFESLKQAECPEWFRDAKFGIWSHWGPQSVPMFGDWYARRMYEEGSDCYWYHLRHYGHPSRFGYKDLVKLWKAEKFDPESLMERYVRAGARYFVAQAMHHDHFANYESKINSINSVSVGPGRDICRLWQAAAQKHGLPFGLSEHMGASYFWLSTNKGADKEGPYAGVPYDGCDPAWRDFYLDNADMLNEPPGKRYYQSPAWFREYWLASVTEMIDRFQPDLLYTDGALPFVMRNGAEHLDDPAFRYGLQAVERLYNTSIARHGENRAVYTQKDITLDEYGFAVLDIEKSQADGIRSRPWQTDSCLGDWFYDVRRRHKKAGHVIEMLIDIVSKNGNLLLNILQRPDGSIDDETGYFLDRLTSWRPIMAEAIHGTRPWKVAGEGNSRVGLTFAEEKQVDWQSSDFRFTSKGKTVYAFMMKAPEDRIAVIRSFADEHVTAVRLLEHGEVEFRQDFGILTVKLPEKLPTEFTNCLAVSISGE